MKNKKRIFIGTIIILILSVLFHSVYEKFPNTFTSFIFPVNESIWEHNKMILLSFLVFTILEKISTNSGKSTIFINFIACILCILILNLSFTPVYLYILNKKDNFILIMIFYVISIILGLLLSERFLIEENKKIEIASLIGYIICFFLMAYLTYYPPHYALFYDYSKSIYGLP